MLKTEAILPAAQVRETAKGKPKHIFSRALPYLMVAPSLTIFSVFVLYPIFYMIDPLCSHGKRQAPGALPL